MPKTTINGEKIKNFNYLINKIEDKHPVFKEKPRCALLIGAGCSFKSKVPLGGDIITICQKLAFLKNEIIGTNALLKRFFETGDIDLIDNHIANEALQKELQVYIMGKQDILKQRVKEDIEIEKKKLQEFVCDFDWDEYEPHVVEDGAYGFWMDEFDNDPKERQRLIEALIERKEPSGAYILLSYLIERGIFNNILTTNFDDFINDALLYYTDTKCRFYADDELSQYISVYSSKPNIIKLHGDYRFVNIKNTGEETMKLSKNLELKMGELLQNFSIIVVGYNGADHSIMNALGRIKQHNKYELIWCSLNPKKVHWRVAHLINNTENSFFVEIKGFDEMMGQLYPHFSKESKPQNLLTKAEIRQKQVDAILQQYAKDFEGSDKVSDKDKEEFSRSKQIDDLFNHAFQERDVDKKIELYNEVLKLDEKNAAVYNNLGVIWTEKGLYDNSIIDYTKAIELNPDYLTAYNNRGISWSKVGKFDKAIEDYTRAIALNPQDAEIYYNRGISWDNKAMYDKAIEDYTKAIELKPDYFHAYNNRGVSLKSLKQYDSAIEDYNQVIALNPEYGDAYYNRGNSWSQLKKHDKAIEDYTTAIQLNHNDAEAYFSRGNSWENKNEYDKAIEDYTAAIQLNPLEARYYNNEANAHRVKGDLDTALEKVNAAILKFPEYGFLYTTLAEIYSQQGKTTEFYKAIEKALQLGASVWDLLEDDAYTGYKNEQLFIDLLAKYKKK